MATRRRRVQPAELRPKSSNPFIHVPFSRHDLQSVERPGGGGKKEFVPVDPEYRHSMLGMLNRAAARLRPDIESHPNVPGVLVLKPDYPENKEDWPFFWGQNEYVVNMTPSYVALVHAAMAQTGEGAQGQ